MSTLRRNDPPACARCAATHGSCCRITPGREEVCFPLSEIEMDRIRDCAPAGGWFAQEPNSAAFLNQLFRLFPGERRQISELFHPNKFHFRLAVDAGGACRFLGPAGCGLPREARPYYCRLFPFWHGADGRALLDGECPAIPRRASAHGGVGQAMAELNMTAGTARELHARLRMAWGLPPKMGMPSPRVSYARTKR